MTHISCGIDFGTTNSVMGVTHDENLQLVPLEKTHTTIPTALFFPKNDQNPMIGRMAIDSHVNGMEGRFMRSIKRILGTDLMDKYTLINGSATKFDDIIALFLRHLKSRAEHRIGSEISSVVLGRPVHYQDNDAQADILAESKMLSIAQSVGFRDIVFQFEPIAGAFAHEQNLTSDKMALVVDLGGGTSDFTVIRIGPTYRAKTDRTSDVLATGGIRIGGNDFDRDLSLAAFMPMFGRGTTYGTKKLPLPAFIFSELSEWSKINFTYTQKNINIVNDILHTAHDKPRVNRLLSLLELQEAHRLLQVVEETKINLTSAPKIEAKFGELGEVLTFCASLELFEKVVQIEADKITHAVTDTLNMAGIQSTQIDMLILTGGTCEIPLIQRTIRAMFEHAMISDTAKMDSVGLGLTHMAKQVFR